MSQREDVHLFDDKNQAWGKNLGVDWWIYHSNRRQPVDFECLMCGIICQESMVTSLKDILLEICHCQTLRTEKFSRRSLSEDALMMSVEFMIHDLSLFWSKFLDVNSSAVCTYTHVYNCSAMRKVTFPYFFHLLLFSTQCFVMSKMTLIPFPG